MAPERRVAPAEGQFTGHPGSPGGNPTPAQIDSLRSWLAGQGVTLPEVLPARAPAAKTSQTDRLLGDGSGDGYVNFWDA